ncbi:MAG: aspartate aminotransferase family protein, partial [Desulfovibrio sp.]|nr:aspartate aminotransferase family protein [Desulfovibrio sp.]
QVHIIASMFTPYFSDEPVTCFDEVKRCDQKLFGEFYRQMRAQGVYLAPSAFETGMVSFVHSDEDFSRTLECAAKVKF